MTIHLMRNVRAWVLEVETVKPSAVHYALYICTTVGLIGVLGLEYLHAGDKPHVESIQQMMGDLWWPSWLITMFVSVTMFFIAQWLIFKSSLARSTYIGYSLLAFSDVATLFCVVSFFTTIYAHIDLTGSANWIRLCLAWFTSITLGIFAFRDFHRLSVIEGLRLRRKHHDGR